MNRNSLPKNLILKNEVILDSMDSTTNWTPSSSAITADTLHYTSGNAAIKVSTTAPGGFAQAYKTVNFDMSDCDYVSFDAYIPDTTQLAGLNFYLFTDISTPKYYLVAANNSQVVSGWNRIVFYKKDFAPTGSPVWGDPILRVKFAMQAVAGQNLSITVDNIRKGYAAIPKAIFTFDDGYQSVYDQAYPIMQAKGFKGVEYIISDTVQSTDVNYMRIATLKTLYNSGWDICNHTKSHRHLADLSDADALNEIKTCDDFLIANGFKNSKHIAYPYGSYNSTTINIAKSLGFLTGRKATQGTKLYELGHNHMPVDSLDELVICPLSTDLTLAQVKTKIDEAVRYGKIIIFLGHTLVTSPSQSYDFSIANFQAVVDYVAQRKIDVVTLSEWYEQLSNPRKKVARI